MSKVSVIIPVYNVENFLKQCLDSVANQTLQDFQVIVVDDGSTDGSGKICDDYAALDSRFIVIHKINRFMTPRLQTIVTLRYADLTAFCLTEAFKKQVINCRAYTTGRG